MIGDDEGIQREREEDVEKGRNNNSGERMDEGGRIGEWKKIERRNKYREIREGRKEAMNGGRERGKWAEKQ